VALKAREAPPAVAVLQGADLQAAVRAAGVPRVARPVALQAVLRVEAVRVAFQAEACRPRVVRVAEQVRPAAPHSLRVAYLQPAAVAKVAAAATVAEGVRVAPVPRAVIRKKRVTRKI